MYGLEGEVPAPRWMPIGYAIVVGMVVVDIEEVDVVVETEEGTVVEIEVVENVVEVDERDDIDIMVETEVEVVETVVDIEEVDVVVETEVEVEVDVVLILPIIPDDTGLNASKTINAASNNICIFALYI